MGTKCQWMFQTKDFVSLSWIINIFVYSMLEVVFKAWQLAWDFKFFILEFTQTMFKNQINIPKKVYITQWRKIRIANAVERNSNLLLSYKWPGVYLTWFHALISHQQYCKSWSLYPAVMMTNACSKGSWCFHSIFSVLGNKPNK